jgi:REP element-mobilizing transposase RayT
MLNQTETHKIRYFCEFQFDLNIHFLLLANERKFILVGDEVTTYYFHSKKQFLAKTVEKFLRQILKAEKK